MEEMVVVGGSQGWLGKLLLGVGLAGAQRHQQMKEKSPGVSVQHRRQLEENKKDLSGTVLEIRYSSHRGDFPSSSLSS